MANHNGRFGPNTFGSRKDRKDLVIYATKAPSDRAGCVRRLVDIKQNGIHREELEELMRRCRLPQPQAWVLAVVEMKARKTSPDDLQAPHCIITRSRVPAPAMERP